MTGSFPRFCALLLVLIALVPAVATAQTEPVQFMISGSIEDGAQAPLPRAQIVVYRQGTDEILAQRIFTGPDGSFSATFQAEVIPNVKLDDPTPPTTPHFDGYWMGEIWPNPYTESIGRGATLPFAAPANVPRPELEIFDARGRRIPDGDLMASGVYFYRLRFEGRLTEARKVVLLSPTRIHPELQRVEGPTKTWEPPQDQAAARRAEGELQVDVVVKKDGYVSVVTGAQLDSRLDNQIDAALGAAPAPTVQMQVGGTLAEGSAVLFDGLGSTDPDGGALTYSWDFGDGVRGGGELVAHVYGADGTYDVELTVSTVHGATATTMQQVTIADLPPVSTGATAVGTIRDAVGNLLGGVAVQQIGGAASGMSDAAGSVTLTGLPTGVPVALECTLPGFTKQVVRLELPGNTVNAEFDATLRRQRAAVEIGAIQDGGDVEGEDGVCVELPADALLKPDGTAATGKANVRLTPIDVSSSVEAEAFPGSYTGVRPDGQDGLLLSFGVAEFVIEQNGEELQLEPGSTAWIEIPIYTPGAAVDDVIPLWSVDETTGLWTEEGSGTVVTSTNSPTGLALRAEVTHFSWWNADAFDDDPYRPIPECKIKDQDGLPTLQIPPGESCYIQGESGPGGPRTRPDTRIGPDNPYVLPLPGGLGVTLNARALNGTKVGTVLINGPSGVTENIEIVLDDLMPVANHLTLPANFEAAIDVVDEIDVYTFDAQIGQDFGVQVARNAGSTLAGTLRVLDPNATEIYSGPFGASSASFAHIVTAPGTYTIEIDGTANEPGGYRLVAQYSEVFQGALPMSFDADTFPGMLHMARVHIEAGTWFSVDYVRRETVGFGAVGWLTVKSPSGADLYDIHFAPTAVDTGLLQATETGEHLIILQSDTIEASYTVFAREVPTVPIGGVVEGSLSEKGTQYFRFGAGQDDFLRSAIDRTTGFSGAVQFVDGNNNFLSGSWTITTQDGSSPTLIPSAGDYFIKLTSSHTPVRTLRDYRISLNEILPPEPLSFDAQGRALVNGGQLGLFGDMRFYSFTASTGDAVVAKLKPGDVTSLTSNATAHLYRVGFGTWQNPQESLFAGSGFDSPGDDTLGVLEFAARTIPANDTYLLVIASRTPEDGAFDFTLDRVAPLANLTVDDDLAQCPGADTRSLHAALLAAPAGGRVDICDGVYTSLVTFSIANPGVEVVGSATDLVTLDLLKPGHALWASQGAARIANLTLRPRVGTNSTGLYLSNGDGTILEDLRFSAVSGEFETGLSLAGSSNQNITMRRLAFDFCQRNIEGRGDNLLIEECSFDTGSQILELQGDQVTLQNNIWTVTTIGEAISIENGAGHQVLDNVINVTTPDFGAPARTFAMSVEDADQLDALPPTVIRGNTINTNEAGMYLGVDHLGSELICEQNTVIMVDGRGQTGIETIVLRDAGNDMTIQNNVLVNAAPWRGLHLRWPDRAGQLTVFNNSISVDSSYSQQVTYPTVRLELAPGSTASGALPVQFVNNVLQGAGAVAIEIPTGTTIDSDYNLLNGYTQYYVNGSTSSGTNDLLGADPLFTGALLELDAASPAVDSGRAAGAPAVDHDGTLRPQGGGVDRGAHER